MQKARQAWKSNNEKKVKQQYPFTNISKTSKSKSEQKEHVCEYS